MANPKPHKPTPQSRERVLNMAIAGFSQDLIRQALKIGSKSTLLKYYRDELTTGSMEATAEVAGHLLDKVRNGDTTAMIFWMKTRAGWREKADVNLTSDDGSMTPPRSITVVGVDAKK